MELTLPCWVILLELAYILGLLSSYTHELIGPIHDIRLLQAVTELIEAVLHGSLQGTSLVVLGCATPGSLASKPFQRYTYCPGRHFCEAWCAAEALVGSVLRF